MAAHPDFDRVHGVDLERQALRFSLDLRAGDEPGRVVEGRDGVVYVVLRGGAIAQIDTATGERVAQRLTVLRALRSTTTCAMSRSTETRAR